VTQKERGERWITIALRSLRSAQLLHLEGESRGVVNRAYYSVYQLATGVCVLHGDEALFPHGWNNPSHDQLPDLIQNNGDLPMTTRRLAGTLLNSLRVTREDADYRPGRTVDSEVALRSLQGATQIFRMLGVTQDD
jgi:uncharacterized protein (UPF0332 family)